MNVWGGTDLLPSPARGRRDHRCQRISIEQGTLTNTFDRPLCPARPRRGDGLGVSYVPRMRLKMMKAGAPRHPRRLLERPRQEGALGPPERESPGQAQRRPGLSPLPEVHRARPGSGTGSGPAGTAGRARRAPAALRPQERTGTTKRVKRSKRSKRETRQSVPAVAAGRPGCEGGSPLPRPVPCQTLLPGSGFVSR